MRIAIIGRSEILFETAEILAASGFEIGIIITAKEAPEYTKTSKDFKDLAIRLKCPFVQTPHIEETYDVIKKLDTINIAVSLNYSGVIPQKIIDLFPMGILNAHGGDLPRFRGNACQAWAILMGEDRVALCVHRMVGGELDSGDIVARSYLSLDTNTRIGDIWSWINKSAPNLFKQALDELASNPNYIIECQSKNPDDALRCYPRTPQDGKIDWNQSAESLSRLVRASSEPYNGAYTFLNGKRFKIWRAFPAEYPCPSLSVPGQVLWRSIETGEVGVATGKGVLVLVEAQLEAEERGAPAEVLKSVRARLGINVEDDIIEMKSRLSKLEQLLA